jgi:YD repeat-containing protein
MSRPLSAFADCSAAAIAALLAAAPALADTTRDNIPQIFTMSPMGVNLQTGVFVHSETDFTIGSLSFVRSWRAVPTLAPSTALGRDHQSFGGWNHNFGFSARLHPSRAQGAEVYADGKVYQFVFLTESQRWIPWNIDQHNNNAFGTELTGSSTTGGNFVFRNHNGDVYTFNSANQATRLDQADGTRLEFRYDGSKRLRTITSSRGDAIVLDYDPGHGRLIAACGYDRAVTYISTTITAASPNCAAAPVKVAYQHSATTAAQGWVLSKVTDAGGTATNFTYDTYHKPNLTCLSLPNSAACRLANAYGPQPGDLEPLLTAPDQVRRQTTATGEVWTYFYINASIYADWPPLQGGEIRQTTSEMTDPLGRGTLAEYENGFLKHLYAPEGHTQYAWAMLNPAIFTSPGGQKDQLGFDLRNNVVLRRKIAAPGTNLANIEATASYPDSNFGLANGWAVGCVAASQKVCNKPLTTTSERGFTTDYVYDPAHGGVLSETGPAVMSNGIMARPQKRYTWEARYSGVKNSVGTIVNAETPVWLLIEERECMTTGSAPGQPSPCANGADEVRIVHEYGATGSARALRPRGKVVDPGGLNLRTCTAYDSLGNAIGSSSPKAAAASAPCL